MTDKAIRERWRAFPAWHRVHGSPPCQDEPEELERLQGILRLAEAAAFWWVVVPAWLVTGIVLVGGIYYWVGL